MSIKSDVQTRKKNNIAPDVGVMTQVYAERAENFEIWDVEGNRYVDFAAGTAVVNTGHRHPNVIEAVKAQFDRFTHSCPAQHCSNVSKEPILTDAASITNDRVVCYLENFFA
jgi:4-aminobutyrate aminotransferase-like enzyme